MNPPSQSSFVPVSRSAILVARIIQIGCRTTNPGIDSTLRSNLTHRRKVHRDVFYKDCLQFSLNLPIPFTHVENQHANMNTLHRTEGQISISTHHYLSKYSTKNAEFLLKIKLKTAPCKHNVPLININMRQKLMINGEGSMPTRHRRAVD